MSQIIDAPDSRPRATRTRRLVALAVAAVVGTAGSILGVTAAQAAVTASVHNTTVQQGAYQTFFVSGLTPSSTLTVKLANTSTSVVQATATYSVGAGGVPTAPYTRIQVPAGTPTGTGIYQLDFYDAGSPTPSYSVTSLSVAAPNNTGTITSATVIGGGSHVRVIGQGFRRVDTAYDSVIGVKLNNGAIKHADTAGDLAPVPKPYPPTGASPADVWFYIGEPNTDPAYAGYNGATGYPNPAYKSGDIAGGSFTVDIPIGSLASGTYQLRFLTGSLDDATWQTPSSSVKPDQGRSVIVSFTK